MSIVLPQDEEKTPVVNTASQIRFSEEMLTIPPSEEASSSMKYLWLTIVFLLVITSVGIGTFLLDGDGKEAPLINALVTPTPVSLNPALDETNTDPMSEWQTFTSETLHYTIKYPPKFAKPVIDADREGTVLFSSHSGKYALVSFPFPGSLEDLYEERSTNIVTRDSSLPFVFSDIPTRSMKAALVDGSKAYWYETKNDEALVTGREVHFVTKNIGYILRSESEQEVDEREMERMLMSFKNLTVPASSSALNATPSGTIEE